MAEWYRNTDWNEEIEAAFFEKLTRARSQRDQYLVIQALTLSESYPEVTLRLVDHYFETRTDDFHDGRARLAGSQARFALGGYEEALDDYLDSLDNKHTEKGMHVASPIKFAFLAARYRSEKHYLRALDMLHDLGAVAAAAPDVEFMYSVAYALILYETGKDPAGAVALANRALDCGQALLDHHPDIVWRLRGITRS